jgi:hypothetical protein
MRFATLSLALLLAGSTHAQDSQPLETPSSPFDFDNYRRTPLQARQNSSSSSKENRNLQQDLISGQKGKAQKISDRAAALFQDPEQIPIRREPEPIPTPNELTDEITSHNYGETTKGQRDLLARGRVAKDLDLSSMSEADYDLYASQIRQEEESSTPQDTETLLRPMPSLMNSKTGGPPHAYSVSQAGIGARSEPRDNQNPFTDLIRVLRLDQPVTKGNDPLPAPTTRLAATSTAPLTPAKEAAPSATSEEAKP